MNKNDLVAKVAADTNLSKNDASEAVEATLANISKSLQQGEEVRLIGFGTFSVSHRAAGEARDPRTGQKIPRPASKVARFKAGKALKDAVNV